MQFNERLKKLRQERGVTQKELADAVYVSRSAVAKWESGLGLPNEESLSLLAEFFGVEEQMLMTDPEVETVIVGKNDALSKQKILIISLAMMLFLISVVMGVLLATGVFKKNAPIAGTSERELIFYTEWDDNVKSYPTYSEAILDPSRSLPESRVFEFAAGQRSMILPDVVLRVRNGDTITHETLDYNKINFSYTSHLSVSTYNDYPLLDLSNASGVRVRVYAYDFDVKEAFNIRYEDLWISVKVIVPGIPAKSISIGTEDGALTVRHAESTMLDVEVQPDYATNVSCTYTIDEIEFPDGSFQRENLAEYAYIKDERCLQTTAKIPLGARIHIIATTKTGVSATTFIEVVRVPVESLQILLNGEVSQRVKLGETYTCTVKAYPENATFNVLNESFRLDMYFVMAGTLEEHDGKWLLSMSSRADLAGERMGILAGLPEGVKTSQLFMIDGGNSERIEIDTGEKFAKTGLLYEIMVLKKPITVRVEEIEFKLLEELEGVYIIENKYVFIAPSVEVGTVIRIQGFTADGLMSNVLELTVI